MTAENLSGLILSALLVAFLVLALIRPEKF